MSNDKILKQQREKYKQQQLSETNNNYNEWKVTRAVKCIHKNLYGPTLTVSEMKRRCRINGHNFAAKFYHYVEMSPKEYINHHRIETAKVLLRDARLNDIAVSLIATEVGFHSISAFSKSFKRHSGITPSKWRQEYNSGAN